MFSRWVVLVVVLPLSWSCSGTPTTHCLASNCAGCCDDMGVCQKGTSVRACGGGGKTCRTCTSNGTCEGGQCIVYGPGDGGEGGGDAAGGGAGGGGSAGGAAGGSAGGSAGGGSAGGGSAGGSAGGAAGGSAGGVAGGTGGGSAGGTSGGTAGGTAGGAAGGTAGGTAGGAAGGAAGGSAGGAGGGAAPTNGLLGQYFPVRAIYTTVPVVRSDAQINFNWGSASPVAGIPTDNFAVRWLGQLEVLTAETYTFYTYADDGTRVWVDGYLLIDNGVNGSASERSGSRALTAGMHDLRVEYYDYTSTALVQLSWSSASTLKQLVPAARLYPPVPRVQGSLQGDYTDDYVGAYVFHRWDVGPLGFDWTTNGPAPSVFPYTTEYSVIWTGTVTPPASATYTFWTTSDDGVRLWVNGQNLINNWTTHGATDDSGSIALTAGVPYHIRLDYFQGTGSAIIRLDWQTSTMARTGIPSSALNP